MMYVDFSAGKNEYKLRLNTRSVVALEKTLGTNPLGIFGDGTQLPTITSIVAVLHASLQAYHHGISMNDAYDIYDEYLAEGHAMTDILPVIIELYKVSGLIREEASNEKN